MERGSHVREALRAGTAETHQALDALWDGKSLAERGHYLRFLAASAAALLPIEAGLAASRIDILVPDWPLRRRSDAITADLAGFGVAVPASDPVAFGSPNAMLGTLYVLEGGGLWRSFLERLDEADPTELELAAMIAGARDAFARFDAAARRALA